MDWQLSDTEQGLEVARHIDALLMRHERIGRIVGAMRVNHELRIRYARVEHALLRTCGIPRLLLDPLSHIMRDIDPVHMLCNRNADHAGTGRRPLDKHRHPGFRLEEPLARSSSEEPLRHAVRQEDGR